MCVCLKETGDSGPVVVHAGTMHWDHVDVPLAAGREAFWGVVTRLQDR